MSFFFVVRCRLSFLRESTARGGVMPDANGRLPTAVWPTDVYQRPFLAVVVRLVIGLTPAHSKSINAHHICIRG